MVLAPEAALVLLTVLGALAPAAQAQILGLGPCPDYQAATTYDQDFKDSLEGTSFVVQLSHDSTLKCMQLEFINSTNYEYTYYDGSQAAPEVQKIEGKFSANPTTFIEPGTLDLHGGRVSVLGADLFGNTRLVPIKIATAGSQYSIFVSCQDWLAYHIENTFVLTNKDDLATAGSPTSIKTELEDMELSRATQLRVKNKLCGASDPTPHGGPSEAKRVNTPVEEQEPVEQNQLQQEVQPEEEIPAEVQETPVANTEVPAQAESKA